jgi:hypothetical protein
MPKVLRSFLLVLVFLAAAVRVDAATVTIAWNANSEPDLARYLVGYRTSPTASETVVSVGLTTTWSLTTATPGSTYYFRVYAENQSGLRSAPSAEVSTTVPTTTPPPTGGGYSVERARLSFSAVKSGATVVSSTPAQTMMVTRTSGTASWTARTSNSWLRVTPTSGSGTAPVSVSLSAGSLNPGTYDGSVIVTIGGTNLNVAVRVRVYAAGTTAAPGGYFDTPADGVTNVAGAIPVTGWAIDDIAVASVDIYRDPAPGEPNNLIFVGKAAFVAGSRPDIEPHFAEYPLNYRAGWGFMVLTNMLPDLTRGRAFGGNGAFRLHAFAVDAEGLSTYLGSKGFNANNEGAVKPFGTLDTPAQGGTASGNAYAVYGWALSPRGTIPTNGSTMSVFVDGSNVGRPVYNQNRADIASAFPGYANSNGAVGYYILDTTRLANGLHTISWVVTDNLGNTEGIGSRFFTVQNGSAALTAAVSGSTLTEGSHGTAIGQTAEAVTAEAPVDFSLVEVKRPAGDAAASEFVFPETAGAVNVAVSETEPIEVKLASQFDAPGGSYEGYVVIDGQMRPLPVGSSLSRRNGSFKWQPGPGFVGNYEFIFVRTTEEGFKTRIPVNITIAPKQHQRDDR